MHAAPSRTYLVPTHADQVRFLLHVYFGGVDNALARAIARAHRDLSRTVHGIGEHPDARPAAAAALEEAVVQLRGNAEIASAQAFDTWHQRTCEALSIAYASKGYSRFTVGQAQKWINMALKYVFVFGEAHLSGYSPIYPFCHVPIDNIILAKSAFAELRKFKEPWSRIADYRVYLSFQHAVRKKFASSAPLAVEFQEWLTQNAP